MSNVVMMKNTKASRKIGAEDILNFNVRVILKQFYSATKANLVWLSGLSTFRNYLFIVVCLCGRYKYPWLELQGALSCPTWVLGT